MSRRRNETQLGHDRNRERTMERRARASWSRDKGARTFADHRIFSLRIGSFGRNIVFTSSVMTNESELVLSSNLNDRPTFHSSSFFFLFSFPLSWKKERDSYARCLLRGCSVRWKGKKSIADTFASRRSYFFFHSFFFYVSSVTRVFSCVSN